MLAWLINSKFGRGMALCVAIVVGFIVARSDARRRQKKIDEAQHKIENLRVDNELKDAENQKLIEEMETINNAKKLRSNIENMPTGSARERLLNLSRKRKAGNKSKR